MFRVHIWGDRACFARPEFKRDRISYDVLPPLAARGIVESIYWSPAIRWRIDRIHVLNPIRFDQQSDGAVCQRDLIDVAYVIETHIELSDRAGTNDHAAQHISLARRRAHRQQPFRQPFLGVRTYPAEYRLLAASESLPISIINEQTAEMGWMVHDLDMQQPPRLRFFRPILRNGSIDLRDVVVDELPE